jgi:murein DD-endopeptidase MepM/ murein hydrolase activator NlpD
MLRRALPSLFCAFALVAPAYGQDVFVPRELKAVAVHPPKTKETVKRSEPAADVEAKVPAKVETAKPDVAKAPKTNTAPAKTEKAVVKEKSTTPKEQKAPLVTDQTTSKKVTEVSKEKEKAPKEKAAKTDDVATIKVEKAVASKEPNSKEKPKVAVVKEKADSELPTIKVEKSSTATKAPSASKAVAKADAPKPEAKSDKPSAKEEPAHKNVVKSDAVKVETVTAKSEKAALKEKDKAATATVAVKDKDKDQAATVAVSKSLKEKSSAKEESPKSDVKVAKTEKPAPVKEKEKPVPTAPKSTAKSQPLVAKVEPAPPREGPTNAAKMLPSKAEQVSIPTQKDPPQIIPAVSGSLDTGFTKIADGFDFPVGKPEAEGYYKARGFRPGGHLGEDWDGVRGGDTDLRDPIYSVGDGIVVFARDVHLGWGNVIIVRHAYRENGNVKYIDALYGHLNSMLVGRGQRVSRGQQIATMGTAHGQYDAHLHFEIRKNLEIGMSRSKFQKDFSNYHDPTQFINSHRHLSGGGANYKVAMNTFTHDWMYHFDKNRDFGSRKRSTSQSSAALRAALTSR